MSRGLHMLGTEGETGKYAPLIQAAGSIAEGITKGLKSSPPPPPPPPPPQTLGSFWTDPLVGPVPGWGVVASSVGVGAILWRVLRGRWGL